MGGGTEEGGVRPHSRTILRVLRSRTRELDSVRDLMASEWEAVPNPALVVRRRAVAAYVASLTGRPLSHAVYNDVLLAARALGWQPIKIHNRSMFRGVKPRSMSMEDALRESRQFRSALARLTKAAR